MIVYSLKSDKHWNKKDKQSLHLSYDKSGGDIPVQDAEPHTHKPLSLLPVKHGPPSSLKVSHQNHPTPPPDGAASDNTESEKGKALVKSPPSSTVTVSSFLPLS